MNTYELFLYPPNNFHSLCKWKTASANSIEEFADICDRDIFLAQLFATGWTIARIKKVTNNVAS